MEELKVYSGAEGFFTPFQVVYTSSRDACSENYGSCYLYICTKYMFQYGDKNDFTNPNVLLKMMIVFSNSANIFSASTPSENPSFKNLRR